MPVLRGIGHWQVMRLATIGRKPIEGAGEIWETALELSLAFQLTVLEIQFADH